MSKYRKEYPTTNYKHRIIKEFYKTIEILGGMSDILSIIGSYSDTLSDKEILDELKAWNKIYSKEDYK